MLLKKTSFEMEAEATQQLMEQGVLTNMTPGGRVRSIISAISKINGRVMDALDVNTAMGFATSATGYFLDLWGQIVGLTRDDAIASYALKEDKNVKFYVTTGVLKDYITSGVLSSGTTIQTSDSGVQFVVTEDTPFPDDATEVYVSVLSTESGAESRVGKGMLVSHSLGDANVFVTNEQSVINGDDQEEDANFRFRIMNQWAARATASATSVRLAALSTPGVADVILTRHFQGPGTADVLLTPVGNRVTESMIVGARARIDRVAAAGDFVTVRGPRYIHFDIDVTLGFTRTTVNEDKPDIRREVRDNILGYFAEIPLGGLMVVQELRARIQETHPNILDHEITCFGINSRPQILRNYRLFDDELFLPDPAAQTPVQVF